MTNAHPHGSSWSVFTPLVTSLRCQLEAAAANGMQAQGVAVLRSACMQCKLHEVQVARGFDRDWEQGCRGLHQPPPPAAAATAQQSGRAAERPPGAQDRRSQTVSRSDKTHS